MRKKIKFLVSLFLLVAATALAANDVVEGIVAIVNDDIITLSEYREYHDSLYQMLRSQVQGEELEKQYNKIKGEILNNLITETLLLQLAKQKEINVQEQLKMSLENLKKQNNIQSDEQLREELRRQGMDYEQFVRQLEDNILKQAVVFSEVDRSIVIDEADVVSYFKAHPEEFVEPEEYKLRAVYLSTEGRSDEELEARKKEISEKLKAGEDFSALAGEYADSPMKENQGDLGHFKPGEMEKVLEEAVVKLKVGEVTPWVQAKNGWYLLKLEEKKESRPLSFEEVKKTIEEKLFSEQRDKRLQEFLKELKEKSYIKILQPNPLNL
jgi:peptidyl-prolyl cis-trans isomerase SurA